MAPEEYTHWTSGIAILAGLWAVAVPFVWSVPETFTYSAVAAGAVIAVTMAFGAYRVYDGDVLPAIPSVAALLAGIGLIAAPFAFGVEATEPLVGSVVAGLIAAAASGFGLYVASEFESVWPGQPTA